MDELLCILDCVDEIPARYDQGLCAPVFRKHGFSGWVAFKCGLAFTDFFDTAEWETKIEAQDIIVSPSFGTFTPGATTTSTIQGGCGEVYPEFSVTAWTYTTPSTKADYTDEDFWYLFNRNANGYTLGYINCDGMLYLNDTTASLVKAWTTGDLAITNPGFSISITNRPQFIAGPNGIGKAGIWSMAGEFTDSDVHRGVEVPGLATVLKSTVVTP